jgi:hypothetical protein
VIIPAVNQLDKTANCLVGTAFQVVGSTRRIADQIGFRVEPVHAAALRGPARTGAQAATTNPIIINRFIVIFIMA